MNKRSFANDLKDTSIPENNPNGPILLYAIGKNELPRITITVLMKNDTFVLFFLPFQSVIFI